MTKEQLAQVQEPLKERYMLNPLSAQTTLMAKAVLGGDISCSSKIGRSDVRTGMHPGVGGSPENICPATLLLDSLAACAGIVMGAVATYMGLAVHSAAIVAEGDLDLRGTLGVAGEAPVGFKEIRVGVSLSTDASSQQVATLLELIEKYCVVYQTLNKPPKISLGLVNSI
jgi:uncharacterized OsmC-like protein